MNDCLVSILQFFESSCSFKTQKVLLLLQDYFVLIFSEQFPEANFFPNCLKKEVKYLF